MLKTSDLMGVSTQLPDGRWVPALPIPHYFLKLRIRDAWLVLTGKAHAIQEG